ncbi:MAG: hypothetical protein KAI76_08040 [Alphaproteobacteria bacterium]|nr:hypothetical protein [Alphaproteobacteria bacterium]
MFIWMFQKSSLNNRASFPYRALFTVLLVGILVFSATASARVPGLSSHDEDNLTVMNIPIVVEKKVSGNDDAVRNVAILKAHWEAFIRLARKSMTPEELKTYEMPDENTILSLMREFEISNVRSSPERYEAIFHVRFSTDILKYLDIKGGAGKSFPTR